MPSRREVLKGFLAGTAASLLGPYISRGATKIRIGFIPLTDCAPVVVAQELGFFKKYGVDVEVSKEASWPNVRDKLLNGELKASHTLFSLPLSVYMGISGPKGKIIPIPMTLSFNGQGITLSNKFKGKVGFRELDKVKAAIEEIKAKEGECTFAMTFPGGTHDIWLRYWLGACGVNPNRDVRVIPNPPPQMVANMKVGRMDGYCVGEPWNAVGVLEGVGFTHIASQDIWKHHPEKVLAFNWEFMRQNPEEVKAIMKAVLEAARWCDDMGNRKELAKILSQQKYVNAPVSAIESRLMGVYDLGIGKHVYKDDYMLFFKNGEVPFPRKSHAIFFLAQFRRWGMVKEPINYKAVADAIVMQDFYVKVAQEMGIPVPKDDMKPLKGFIDGVVFDPNDPEGSIKKYKVREV
ncbi:nitrate transporter periplasmic component [Thermocrinis albus DSM 14484]|uniref:Nitrate transporter periplasmic component n=1 Tax=Thermocrinis albus (strain DSM 14484 / JCM 11386 / HI 11/12) TaxID=638303 RepID=D3SMH2_THEAH|nr:CmpA/NrtA family ABC transporter substrate-binding protein [Thermocrinis albus]ADC89952.1 nitrate transporter periplasmic component [Thermocrinis albus DSM 14484]